MSQIRADNITNRQGTGAPIFVNGIRVVGLTSIANIVAGIATFTSDVSIGGTLTYEDVTNIDAVGLITARTGVKVTAGGIDVSGGGANIVGILTTSDQIRIAKQSGALLELTTLTNGADSSVRLHEGSAGSTSNGGAITYSGADNKLHISCGTDLTTKRITITRDTGSVGIATEAPAGTLHVEGNQVGTIVAMPANSVVCSAGNYFTKTITGATTFTFDSVPTNVEYSFTLEVTLNGSNSITWPTTVKWNADTPPTITDGKTQMFMFLTSNGGTRWRGSALVDYVN